MGKHGKKLKQHQQDRGRRHCTTTANLEGDVDADALPSSAYSPELSEHEVDGVDDDSDGGDHESSFSSFSMDSSSKFSLYQKSVQSPKGDISYLQKFFLMYVGGRMPLHLQEDFCGTALLSTEWLRSDARRTAVGLDIDIEALNWCLENNVDKIREDRYSRLHLFHGNVLHPLASNLVACNPQNAGASMSDHGGVCLEPVDNRSEIISGKELGHNGNVDSEGVKKIGSLPPRDIICAFNYSCCCLQNRADLVRYFKNSIKLLSRNGGIFVMDLYGGTSSECELRLKRRFPNFTYVWEQEEFDIINRTTRISLHFHLDKKQVLRHAFTYRWRLWSLPEIKDCMLEAGFQSVHVWIRQMPDTDNTVRSSDFNASQDVKYEEVTSGTKFLTEFDKQICPKYDCLELIFPKVS